MDISLQKKKKKSCIDLEFVSQNMWRVTTKINKFGVYGLMDAIYFEMNGIGALIYG